jgi:hypothetical protein
MRLLLTIFATALVLSFAPEQSRAGDGAPNGAAPASAEAAGAVLYLDRSGWRQADRTQKAALATDFMRIFCGNPDMSPLDLVACLDDVSDSELIFGRALSCVAAAIKPAGRDNAMSR